MAAAIFTAKSNDEDGDSIFATLGDDECWWRDRYEMFLKHGYQLRPRYRPGWIPSWVGTRKSYIICEDVHANKHLKTMDAKRLSDGKRVKMKKLIKGSKELEIARFLSSEELAKDPRNHCVPVLDVFSEDDSGIEFMVMPLLLPCLQPLFAFVEEIVDFMKQVLEGLVFLHEHGVAHRDCSAINIMLDGERLFPKGFHPSLPTADESGRLARPRRRRDVPGLKYYFTDFGLSSRFDGTEQTRLVTGKDGIDRDVPELHQSQPYDPFPVDIFILGNLFRVEFFQVYENFGFLEPLIERMLRHDPTDRPTAQEALQLFTDIVEKLPPRSLRWRLIYFGATRFERFMWTTKAVAHEITILVKSILPIRVGRG